jgi:hypothetical protein
MDVKELSNEQMSELRWNYFYDVDNDYEYPHEIPDEVIFEHYDGIDFVNDDFGSTMDKDVNGLLQELAKNVCDIVKHNSNG